jgi:hypothetical protein
MSYARIVLLCLACFVQTTLWSSDGAIAGPRPGDHIINYSGGGVVGHYMELADSHSRVVINGPCYSACAWMFTAKRNVCWTQNATFAFHVLKHNGSHNFVGTGWLAADVRKGLQRYAFETASTSALVHVPQAAVQSTYPDRRC